MKTLVKITSVQDGIVSYDEISRTTNKVMISDTLELSLFIKAIESKSYGFELCTMTKKVAIDTLALFGIEVSNWEYIRCVTTYECSISTLNAYDNGYGYMQSSMGIAASTQKSICTLGIISHFN